MSICHCLSVKKKVSVKNVKILEMSDFGNSGREHIQQTRLRWNRIEALILVSVIRPVVDSS